MEHTNRLTVLVVDDDDGHRELIRRNLQRGGFTNPIIGLTNGNDALDYVFCRAKYADKQLEDELVILLDINMPGMNGIEVLHQIKSDPQKRTIPVIMLTTADDPREVDRCYELGCSFYVTKPVDPNAFIDAIKSMGKFIFTVRAPRSVTSL